MDSDEEGFDDVNPESIQIQAVDGYHLGGRRFSASFELSDEDENYFRSYLLDVELGRSLTYSTRKVIDDTIMTHASLERDHHLVLEIGGLMHELTPAGDTVASLPEGCLRRLFRLKGGPQYVVGDDGVGYLRSGSDWQLIPPVVDTALRDIHGPRPDLVHACGTEGTLLRLKGSNWETVPIPHQADFNAIEVSDEGMIHLGGAEGLALAIRDDELIELSAPPHDFFGIRTFRGRRYWSDANYGLNVQDGDVIAPFRALRHAFSMHASPEFLVIAGWKEFFVFDGENWDGFELGYDGNIFLTRVEMRDFEG